MSAETELILEGQASAREMQETSVIRPQRRSILRIIGESLLLLPPLNYAMDEQTHLIISDHTKAGIHKPFVRPLESDLGPTASSQWNGELNNNGLNNRAFNAQVTQMSPNSLKIYNDLELSEQECRLCCFPSVSEKVKVGLAQSGVRLADTVRMNKEQIRDPISYDNLLRDSLLANESFIEKCPVLSYYKCEVFVKNQRVDIYPKGRVYLSNKRLLFMTSNMSQATDVNPTIFGGAYNIKRKETEALAMHTFPIESIRGADLSTFIQSRAEGSIYKEHSYGIAACIGKTLCCGCCDICFCPSTYQFHLVGSSNKNYRDLRIGFYYPEVSPYWGATGYLIIHIEPQSSLYIASDFYSALQRNAPYLLEGIKDPKPHPAPYPGAVPLPAGVEKVASLAPVSKTPFPQPEMSVPMSNSKRNSFVVPIESAFSGKTKDVLPEIKKTNNDDSDNTKEMFPEADADKKN